jgi:hypothetical protein
MFQAAALLEVVHAASGKHHKHADKHMHADIIWNKWAVGQSASGRHTFGHADV